MKQLIVRVEAVMIRRLKVLAAHDNTSMAMLVRSVLDEYVATRKKDAQARKALEAAEL